MTHINDPLFCKHSYCFATVFLNNGVINMVISYCVATVYIILEMAT